LFLLAAVASAASAQTYGRPAPALVSFVYNFAPTEAQPAPVLTATVEVRLPADAELWFEGVQMAPTGERRVFTTPALRRDLAYTYDIFAQWRQEGRDVTRSERLTVRAGESVVVDLTPSAPREPAPFALAVREIVGSREVVRAALGTDTPARAAAAAAPPRPLPGRMTIIEIDTPPRSPGSGRPTPAADVRTEFPAVPVRQLRAPDHMSIIEIDTPTR
jgi:uncharacterized protein (TIGR03000 family)